MFFNTFFNLFGLFMHLIYYICTSICVIMKKNKVFLALIFATLGIQAAGPWKTILTCPQEKIDLNLDLYEESVEVPGFEDFGPMNGYLSGNIYGVWYVTGYDIKDDKNVTIKVANDLGSENQKIQLTQTTDSTWNLKFVGGNVVKRVSGKKLVKIPNELIMKKK